MVKDKRYGPGARAMAKEDRDETGDVGSGRRRITRDDKGDASQKKDKASEATKAVTEKKNDKDK